MHFRCTGHLPGCPLPLGETSSRLLVQSARLNSIRSAKRSACSFQHVQALHVHGRPNMMARRVAVRRAYSAMGEALTLQRSARVPAPADHVALRALMKYMSSVLAIPYKSISSGTPFDESSVKNYTNDKSSRSLRATEMYTAFSTRCAAILAERGRDIRIDDFVVSILEHLFGDQ